MVDRIAKQMGATTLNALKRLGSALESIAISVGSVLLPAITGVAETFAKVASGVSLFAETFPFLTQVIATATVGIIGLRIAVIAGSFAWTFMQGAWLTFAATLGFAAKTMAFASAGLARINVLSAATAVRMAIVTAAQWALNTAMTANPIGLIIVGMGALIGSAMLLIKNWSKVKTFFGGLWEGIKNLTGPAINWLLDKLSLLLNPFKMLMKAKALVVGGIGRLLGDDKAQQTLTEEKNLSQQSVTAIPNIGSVVNQSTAASNDLATLSRAETTVVNQASTQSVTIDAPITINAAPGVDEAAIAQQVHEALDQRQAQANAARRSHLFDEALI